MDFHRIKSVLIHHTPNPSEWKGAVVFLCNEEHVFLIKRSESMPTHAGQIAFVGGHKQEGENSPWEVAQREFEEETSFDRSHLEYLGYLPVVMTARSQPIVPVVARLAISSQQFLSEVKSNGEWDDIMAYPWSALAQEEGWEYAWRHADKKSAVMFHSIQAGSYLHTHQNVRPYLLWGATANMIWEFLRLYFNRRTSP